MYPTDTYPLMYSQYSYLSAYPPLKTPECLARNEDDLSVAGLSGQLLLLQQKVISLESAVASLRKLATLQAKKIASLEGHVSDLSLSLGGYRLLRNRFIGTFKRDKLGDMTPSNRRIIAKGNSWAHGGDAVADAQLYKGTAKRSDPGDFEKLYGLPPKVVANLSMSFLPTFKLSIYTYANNVSSTP